MACKFRRILIGRLVVDCLVLFALAMEMALRMYRTWAAFGISKWQESLVLRLDSNFHSRHEAVEQCNIGLNKKLLSK
jgi:hypothetical protein